LNFASESADLLFQVRNNVLAWTWSPHMAAGTIHGIAPGKSSPPAPSGQPTLMLRNCVDPELARRKAPR
jgi:hypothetical protein